MSDPADFAKRITISVEPETSQVEGDSNRPVEKDEGDALFKV